jgi:hypothetical protein
VQLSGFEENHFIYYYYYYYSGYRNCWATFLVQDDKQGCKEDE